MNLSLIALKLGEADEALVLVNKAIDLNSSYLKAILHRATIHNVKELFDEAVRDYEVNYTIQFQLLCISEGNNVDLIFSWIFLGCPEAWPQEREHLPQVYSGRQNRCQTSEEEGLLQNSWSWQAGYWWWSEEGL